VTPLPPNPPATARPSERITALVVSGFLGSGKTTLVRQLLEEAQRASLVLGVISNEFGELGIDAALLGDASDAYVELEGGCVCCKLSDELVATIQLLRERVKPQRIVVETSGVALPYDTQIHFWRPPIRDWIEDSLAVVVVSAEQLLAERDLDGTFEDQVSSADLLLLSKLDLVPPQARPELERRLGALAPGAPIVPCIRGRVPWEVFFPSEPRDLRMREREVPPEHSHEAFRADELAVEPGVGMRQLEQRLQQLGALRIKGFVQTAEGLCLVQGVGERIEIEPAERAPAGHVGRLVVIRRA